nr:hypothetical protein [uncultured Anaerocolumna sp.]
MLFILFIQSKYFYLLFANDSMAIEAIKAFRDNGIRVPGDY